MGFLKIGYFPFKAYFFNLLLSRSQLTIPSSVRGLCGDWSDDQLERGGGLEAGDGDGGHHDEHLLQERRTGNCGLFTFSLLGLRARPSILQLVVQ